MTLFTRIPEVQLYGHDESDRPAEHASMPSSATLYTHLRLHQHLHEPNGNG